MTAKSTIVSAIGTKIGTSSPNIWRIGLTHDLADRKKHWKDVEKQDISHWSDWQADTLSDAQAIEAHFIGKGMKGGTGGDLSSYKTTYVYVF